MTVLVVSRVVGNGDIWSYILGSKVAGQLWKNIIQEGLELWGYAIIATGAWYVMSQLTKKLPSRVKPQLSKAIPTT